MAIKSTTEEEYKTCTTPLQYPILSLIQARKNKITSLSPLRWRLTQKEGLTYREIRRKSYLKGEPLESSIEMALQMLNVTSKNTAEQLEESQYYKNCCYTNNGYGADFILDDTLIESKLRGKYLTPKDIYLNVLPRFVDLDPNHKKQWILIAWTGGLSDNTKKTLKQLEVHLIQIPFVISRATNLKPKRKRLVAAYIAERLKETLTQMSLFTHTSLADYCSRRERGVVGDVGGLEDGVAAVSSTCVDACLPFMRGFCGLNPDFLPVNPHVDVYNPYVEDYRQYAAYDPYRIRERNMMIMKYMLETEEFRSALKEWRERGLINS